MNLLKRIFQKFRVPISRQEESIDTFLEINFAEFQKELNILLESRYIDKNIGEKVSSELRDASSLAKNFSNDILETLNLYRCGKIPEAYKIFHKNLDHLEDYFLYREIQNTDDYHFCRIRPDKGNHWTDLFHIPFDEAEKVKGYRYSVTGVPSLYLAGGGSFWSTIRGGYDTALSLAWFESNVPIEFYWSKIYIKGEKALKILDFTLSPFSSPDIGDWIINSIYNDKLDSGFLIKSMVTYPLLLACSLIVKDRNKPFIPEYIIPQMLLSWVRDNVACRGIAYKSNSSIEHVRSYYAYNMVFPTISCPKKGHCEQLLSNFKVSHPQRVSISQIFRQLDSQYRAIRRFQDWFDEIYKNRLALEGFQDIHTICSNFISIYEQIEREQIKNLEGAYQQIHTLNLYAEKMISKEAYQVMINDITKNYNHDKKATDILEEVWREWKSTREVIRNIWKFDIQHFKKIS